MVRETPPGAPVMTVVFCQIGDDVDPFGVLHPPLSQSTTVAPNFEPFFEWLTLLDNTLHNPSSPHQSTAPPPPTP